MWAFVAPCFAFAAKTKQTYIYSNAKQQTGQYIYIAKQTGLYI